MEIFRWDVRGNRGASAVGVCVSAGVAASIAIAARANKRAASRKEVQIILPPWSSPPRVPRPRLTPALARVAMATGAALHHISTCVLHLRPSAALQGKLKPEPLSDIGFGPRRRRRG